MGGGGGYYQISDGNIIWREPSDDIKITEGGHEKPWDKVPSKPSKENHHLFHSSAIELVTIG